MKRCLPLLLLTGVLACDRPPLPPVKVAPSVLTVPPQNTGSDAWPSKAEVLEYLDGKELPLASRPGDSVTIRKDRVKDLQVQTRGSATKGWGPPWRTPINFVVTTPDGRYAVDADVLHQMIDEKRAFFRLEFKTVAVLGAGTAGAKTPLKAADLASAFATDAKTALQSYGAKTVGGPNGCLVVIGQVERVVKDGVFLNTGGARTATGDPVRLLISTCRTPRPGDGRCEARGTLRHFREGVVVIDCDGAATFDPPPANWPVVRPDAGPTPLDGDWQQVREGPAGQAEDWRGHTARISGGEYIRQLRGAEFGFRYWVTVRADKLPVEIDLRTPGSEKVVLRTPGSKEVIRGIYELENGTLRIVLARPGDDRPTSFDARKEERSTLYTFRRATK